MNVSYTDLYLLCFIKGIARKLSSATPAAPWYHIRIDTVALFHLSQLRENSYILTLCA